MFVDESGSFDSQIVPSRFYVIALVFHDQSFAIASQIAALEEILARIGYPSLCFHAGPIIRREDEFRVLGISVRRKLFHLLDCSIRIPVFTKDPPAHADGPFFSC